MEIIVTIPESQRELIAAGLTFNPGGKETLDEVVTHEFAKKAESWAEDGRQRLLSQKMEVLKASVEAEVPAVEKFAVLPEKN